MSVYKKFDKSLYEENDKIGKTKVLNYLRNLGIEAIENPNKYGIDIMIASIEIERRPIWKGSKFPFDTINIPIRKEKFFKNNIKYFVLNNDCSYALICDSEKIVECSKIENSNKFVKNNELFYSVPISFFKIVKLE